MEPMIRETLETWGLRLTEEQIVRLELFKTELLEKNSRLNLVSDNDAGNLWPRHILDSLAGAPLLAKLLKPGAAVADAGAGAGFPGIPLAVVLEPTRFDLWDSSLKRSMFLTCAASRLRLKTVRALHSRIGQSGPLEAGKYGAVVERAMGKLENILPQCLNMVQAGGVFLAWQTAAQLAQERPAALEAARKAGAEPAETVSYRLPGEPEDRHIIVFRKRSDQTAM
ncbi:MAG: 16S rRNA (guanine(527)-N(7))-methyltransferase RsmG [Elusimicrobiales bacterium]|jgi:16S rRNA (guanine527-N7)-methyltransferase